MKEKSTLTGLKIDHMDPLGQGVSKIDDKITFVGKVLPGEEGLARIFKEKSKIKWGVLETLSKVAPNRITPLCPHYDNCTGCHYLHTDYNSEIGYKKSSLLWAFKKWGNPEELESRLEIIPSIERFHYRNRLQLHYNIKEKKIGLINPTTKKIVRIPECKLPISEIGHKLREIYQNDLWIKKAGNKKIGHVEFYFKDKIVIETWNQRYSQGGFTQVNSSMNQKLQEIVLKWGQDSKNILDIFGGQGNLSQSFDQNSQVIIIDSTPIKYIKNLKNNQQYLELNLHKKNSLEYLQKNNLTSPDLVIIDPPRAGHKDLSRWISQLLPNKLIYVSCHVQTMIRDIAPLQETYHLKSLSMIDLFPSTYHFETAILLEKK